MNKKITSENSYLVAPTAILDIPIPLESWVKPDGTFQTINENISAKGHTIKQFSGNKLMFAKGFNWTFAIMKEVEEKSKAFGLDFDVNVFILNHDELIDMIHSKAWLKTDELLE